jgi:hypothetical protein
MFEKVMNFFEWCFLATGVVLIGLVVVGIVKGLTFGIICLRNACASSVEQPDVYWIFMALYFISLPVVIYSMKRSWRVVKGKNS